MIPHTSKIRRKFIIISFQFSPNFLNLLEIKFCPICLKLIKIEKWFFINSQNPVLSFIGSKDIYDSILVNK